MKTQTAYIPLKEGDRIASGHYAAHPEGLIKCGDGIIGERFNLNDHYQVFSTIEVPVSEPEPDPYAELKAAFAAGKTIQGYSLHDEQWRDLPAPAWSRPAEDYRVKPEPVKVPLGPEDVPPGSAFRPIGGDEWRSIQGPTESGVVVAFVGTVTWDDLAKRYEISRDFGKTWHPCWKEVAK